MPYIKKEDREKMDLTSLAKEISTPGELNYVYSVLAQAYVETKGLSYNTVNDVMGVFESAKQEFYRRKVAPYEDIKIEENGDI